MDTHDAHPLKRSRDEIAKCEKKRRKRRKLINWKLPSNRKLMEKAIWEVLKTGKSTYVSKKYNIPLRTLRRYVATERRVRNGTLYTLEEKSSSSSSCPVGDDEFEDFLSKYFLESSNIDSCTQEWEFVPISRVL